MATKKAKWQQGKYRPINPKKYKGDLRQLVFRSSWEFKLFRYCDITDGVIEWSAESVIVPYKHPISGNVHRYFVDVYLKHMTKDGEIKKKLIEVKPAKQVRPPARQSRKTKRYLKEVETYIINKAKWNAADKYARKRGMDFIIFTEKQLGIH